MDEARQAEIVAFLLGLSVGAILAAAVALSRAPTALVRRAGVIFCLAVACYSFVVWWRDDLWIPMVIGLPTTVLSVGAVGWMWLFVKALFEDREPLPGDYAAVALLTAVGLVAVFSPPGVSSWIWVASNLGQAALLLHALYLIVRSARNDLVEARRRLRSPFLAIVAVYTLLMRGMEVLYDFGMTPGWYTLFNAATLALLCLASAFIFLDARAELFGPARPHTNRSPDPAPLDRVAKVDLERLTNLMQAGEAWREEGLTISRLAIRMNMPEAHLRRLINDQLGFRNFPSFVNAHRIEAAKTRLADPAEARTPVSAIAFDLGFGSLGPFNRAFREVTGLSPTEWRRKAFSDPSPEPGKS